MITGKSLDHSGGLVDSVAQSADHAIKSTQRVANEALDTLSGTANDLRGQAGDLLNRTSGQAGAALQQGADSVRESARQLRQKARHASDTTVRYIRDEPVKAMLIAAATGAALMAMVALMGRTRDR